MSSRAPLELVKHSRLIPKTKERKHVPGIVVPFLVRELISDLTPAEWTVWSICFLHANRELTCYLTNDTLCSESGIGWNTVHRAKKNLKQKGWLKICGQRDGRGPNVYKMIVPIPNGIEKFIGSLWDSLNLEPWWNNLGAEKFDYREEHLDWLIAWRVIRCLKEASSILNERPPWTAQAPISQPLHEAAIKNLLARLRKA